jgi:predicted NBD/HSP70 family sugar kinase
MTVSNRAFFLPPLASASRSANERSILGLLLSSDQPMNRAAIADAIGLTLQSVSRLVESMIERDLLYIGERVARQGPGSPSPAVMVNGDAAYAIGLSITTDRISATILNLRGDRLGVIATLPSSSSRDAILDSCAELVENLLVAHVKDRSRVIGIGLVMTGFFVDERRVNPPELLAALAHIDLPSLLQERCGYPVILENDGTAVATAETFLGVGRRYPTFGYLYFSAGIGGGIVLDGQVIRGWRGNACEMRSMFTADTVDDRPTLELLRAMLCEDGHDMPSIAAMLDRFDVSWPTIDRWIAKCLPGLNMIITSISAIFDPAVIVLGGRLPTELALRLIDNIKPFTQPRLGVMPQLVPVVPSEIVDDPAVIGGAAIPLRAYFFPRSRSNFNAN